MQLAVAASLALSAFGSARTAHATSSYPPEVAKALEQQFPGQSYCVPQCITCHLTNEGGFGTMNVFGKNLETKGMLPPGNPALVAPAFDRYFKLTPAATDPQASTLFIDGTTRPFFDSDQDGVSDYTELQKQDSPSVPLPAGVGEFCPTDAPQYGCFARVAGAPPPVDRLGLLSAGLVVFGLAAFRRFKRAPRAS
ncbi:MAG TPA: hypothetical protein VFK05_34360 [Polyangiaceae bacterium]|nr:hypothetical protein [Polyangiaceae bacterium]